MSAKKTAVCTIPSVCSSVGISGPPWAVPSAIIRTSGGPVPTTCTTARLDTSATTLVFDLGRGVAELVYAGAPLPATESLPPLAAAKQRALHECEPDKPVPRSILPCNDTGYAGEPLFEVHRAGQLLALGTQPVSAAQIEEGLLFRLHDAQHALRIDSRWQAQPSGVVTVEQSVTALESVTVPLQLQRFASLVLPLPRWVHRLTSYSGRWSAEMHQRSTVLADAPGLRGVTRGGRSGFAAGQWLLFESEECSEQSGWCIGVHLAWSGDHEWQLDTDQNGDAVLWLGGRWQAGEVELLGGATFRAPGVVLAIGTAGRASLRHLLHRHVSDQVLPQSFRNVPRKVHLNTWEACGFEMSMPQLLQLAAQAAALGVERFVLDDGWFAGRRNDRSSLGDWQPSSEIFPQGLSPLIDAVQRLGMDFGLWVEPEMVSPDSALYRQHPEWCIALPQLPQATQRHQLVLDLSRAEVREYLFDCLDALLRRQAIVALKWDHNRELFPVAHRSLAQTRGVYALLDRLREAHPQVEIESCASGGGRVDYAILSRCSRFWASDNNDAAERLRINRSWLQFLPLRSCGNHVGPSPNPITGRVWSMDFRAKVALFGHMGIEANPAHMSAEDREVLAAHIALYKRWRSVLHEGTLYELPSQDPGVLGWQVTLESRSLALVTQVGYAKHFEAEAVRFAALQPDGLYRVRLPEPWPQMAARYLAAPHSWREGIMLSGAALMHSGIALPLRHPGCAWLIEVETV
ncbi:MAG: alpha-galactosidase [Sinobacteraceae bacterium]|nr:alpha-galactosidase [Nevskiaceae bacterium]